MGETENFRRFCRDLQIDNKPTIKARREKIVKRLNLDFHYIESDQDNYFYVGSFGRGTAINYFHDVDMAFQISPTTFSRFDGYASNGQSSLLQAVKKSVETTYSRTNIGGDGQVVVVSFDDGMRFEILPIHWMTNNTFKHPDSNNGGSWRDTDPHAENASANYADAISNGNYKRLCQMARAWKRQWSVEIKGILLDVLAYNFLINWWGKGQTYFYHDLMVRDFFSYLSVQDKEKESWPGFGKSPVVKRTGVFEVKAESCIALANEAIKLQRGDNLYDPYRVCDKWREIFGDFFPEFPQ